MKNTFKLLITSIDNKNNAKIIGKGLIKNNLASCVQYVENVKSIYKWKDKIESSDEILLLIKTKQDKLDTAKNYIIDQHTYDVPEIISLNISSLNHKYTQWMLDILNN